MRISEALNRPVVSTSSAETIGKVDGFLFDPAGARITALRLRDVSGEANLLSWSDLTAFGVDAVTIADSGVLRAAAGEEETRRADSELDPIGKPALAETGNGLGTVADVDFDATAGDVRAVMTDRFEIPAEQWMGLGTYAAVFAGDRA